VLNEQAAQVQTHNYTVVYHKTSASAASTGAVVNEQLESMCTDF